MKKVSIILPVIRPEGATRCITEIKKLCNPDSYEIVSEVDTNRIGCPKMIKRLVAKAKYDLVMFLGDDTIPQAGFMTAALKAMDTLPDGWGLVGLNDQSYNSKMLATHWLADKRLLPLLGGDFFHTGYIHSFCDNELTQRCKGLGRFTWSKDANIIHDHPIFKDEEFTGDYARVYSRDNMDHDLRLYQKRQNKFVKQPETSRVIAGTPMHKNMHIDVRTAEFCFKEFSGRNQWHWSVQTSESAADARNTVVMQMLNDNFTHLFFIDADTFPTFGTVDKLLSHDKDIVAGVTPIWKDEKLWNFRLQKNEPVKYGKLPDTLFKAEWIGGTTILIKRKVFEVLRWPFYEGFMHPALGGVSHDYYWCDKVRKLGFEIWIDPTIECGHSNTVNLLDVF